MNIYVLTIYLASTTLRWRCSSETQSLPISGRFRLLEAHSGARWDMGWLAYEGGWVWGKGEMGEREWVMSSGSVQSHFMICFCSRRPTPRKSYRSWVTYRKFFTRGKWVWWNWQPDRLVQCNLWPPILSPPQNGCHQKPASLPPWVGCLGKEALWPRFIRAHEGRHCGCLRWTVVIVLTDGI